MRTAPGGVYWLLVNKMQKKSLKSCLIWTFAISWALWIPGALILGVRSAALRNMEALGMFAPLAAAVIVSRGITQRCSGIAWRRRSGLRAGLWGLGAFILPAALTLAGGAVYYLMFPSQFDPSLGLISEALEGSGVTPGRYIIMLLVQSVTAAPLVNGLLLFGAASGWIGYIYPALRERLGTRRGLLAGGLLWGLWLAPLVVMGQSYGVSYPGYPVLGILAMCLACTAEGILLTLLYEKTGSVIFCAIACGGLDACAALPQYVMVRGAEFCPLLGPGGAPGLLSGIVVTLTALAVFLTYFDDSGHCADR